MSSWVICVTKSRSRPLGFPHPRADAAATEHGAANRSPPMAETVVWACRATDTLSRRSSESTRARPPPNDSVEEKRQRRWTVSHCQLEEATGALQKVELRTQ